MPWVGGASLAVGGAVGILVGWGAEPYVGSLASLALATAAGGGLGSGVWAWRNGRPRSLLDAL